MQSILLGSSMATGITGKLMPSCFFLGRVIVSSQQECWHVNVPRVWIFVSLVSFAIEFVSWVRNHVSFVSLVSFAADFVQFVSFAFVCETSTAVFSFSCTLGPFALFVIFGAFACGFLCMTCRADVATLWALLKLEAPIKQTYSVSQSSLSWNSSFPPSLFTKFWSQCCLSTKRLVEVLLLSILHSFKNLFVQSYLFAIGIHEGSKGTRKNHHHNDITLHNVIVIVIFVMTCSGLMLHQTQDIETFWEILAWIIISFAKIKKDLISSKSQGETASNPGGHWCELRGCDSRGCAFDSVRWRDTYNQEGRIWGHGLTGTGTDVQGTSCRWYMDICTDSGEGSGWWIVTG